MPRARQEPLAFSRNSLAPARKAMHLGTASTSTCSRMGDFPRTREAPWFRVEHS